MLNLIVYTVISVKDVQWLPVLWAVSVTGHAVHLYGIETEKALCAELYHWSYWKTIVLWG